MSSRATSLRQDSSKLDTARRIEVLILVVLSLFAALQDDSMARVGAGAFLVMAVMLAPRERRFDLDARGADRLNFLNKLQAEAIDLRTAFVMSGTLPVGEARCQALWQAEREILTWQLSALKRLKRYPEIAGIIDARTEPGAVLGELDSCIRAISEARRLSLLSERLHLPI